MSDPDLQRSVVRLPRTTAERIDEIARIAGDALGVDVSSAAVVRAGLLLWLKTAENGDPAPMFAAIRAAIVPRGRKSR